MKNNELVRSKTPLVHCITNYVTVNDVANILLACGGSPIMADDIVEVAEITAISNALLINIGTLNERTIESMICAGMVANKKNIPVILDPVGAGASNLRNITVKKLLNQVKMSVIRGNLSELSFIAGLNSNTRGVDSNESDNINNPVEVAKTVAKNFNAIVAITGAIDVVTDGKRVAKISNGVPLMRKVTGTGCMLSAVIGAYIGAVSEVFEATVTAISSMGIAGELALKRVTNLGTGSFHIAIIDEISKINDDIIDDFKKVTYEK